MIYENGTSEMTAKIYILKIKSIQGFSLNYILIVFLIISSILMFFLTSIFLENRIISRSVLKEKIRSENFTVVSRLINKKKLEGSASIISQDSISTEVNTSLLGLFKQVTASTHRGKDTVKSGYVITTNLPKLFNNALVLSKSSSLAFFVTNEWNH
ncbi:MAG: hypothetical protein KKD86_02580 [Bacteroidetes bacterium]|nr:hypothetical protein [Bacteroidota bacterium]MBU1677736.1 hypothetical protein [Bacteroidota bacterium]